MCDGYSAYASLEERSKAWGALQGEPGFTLAHCWAHVRRKLFDAEKAYPEAKVALEWIRELYAVEDQAREKPIGKRRKELAELRDSVSRPIVDELSRWLLKTPALPESLLGKAIRDADGFWPGLMRFLDDPRIPLDNNGAERALLGVVLGRTNHYGSKSKQGTEVAALFYSLLETAKLAGLEPAGYLAQAARRAIANPGPSRCPIASPKRRTTRSALAPSRTPSPTRSSLAHLSQSVRTGYGAQLQLSVLGTLSEA